jgi:hypothetical protein
MEQHLFDNYVPLEKMNIRVGRQLQFDGVSEAIIHDEHANRLLRKHYREPFILNQPCFT